MRKINFKNCEFRSTVEAKNLICGVNIQRLKISNQSNILCKERLLLFVCSDAIDGLISTTKQRQNEILHSSEPNIRK